ncbi:MAG: hypothetical protein ACYDAI_17055 [Trichloromonadaceae bacterium]
MFFQNKNTKELVDCADAMGYQSFSFGSTDWENLSSLLDGDLNSIKHIKEDFIVRQAIFYIIVTINLILINFSNEHHETAIKALIRGFKERLNEANCKETTNFIVNLLNEYVDIFSCDHDFRKLIDFQKKFFTEAIGTKENYGIIVITIETLLYNSISTFPFKKLFPNKFWYKK